MNSESAKLDRDSAQNAIDRVTKWVDKNKVVDTNPLHFLNRIDILRNAFLKYSDAQDYLNSLDADLVDADERDAVDDLYINTLSVLQECIDKLSPSRSTAGRASRPASPILQAPPTPQVEVKLPQINIKPFKGDPAEWQSFIQLYNTLIIENVNLSDIQRFIYLKSFLRDEALNLIDDLSVTNENFDIALEILQKRYENKLSVVNAHFSSIFDMPSLTKCNASTLREFVMNFTRHWRSLFSMGYSQAVLLEALTIFLLGKKIDFATRKAFESERDLTVLPTIEEFKEFLEKKCLILENLTGQEAPSTQKPLAFGNKGYKRTSLHTQSNSNNSNVPPPCSYCKDSKHRIYVCQKFKGLSDADKQKFVQSQKLCYNCLGANHNITSCTSTRTCLICSKKHHSLLHSALAYKSTPPSFQNTHQGGSGTPQSPNFQREFTSSQNRRPPFYSQGQEQNNNNSQNRPQGNSSNHQNRQADNTQSFHSVSAFCARTEEVLLATACVSIFDANGQRVQAKAILDNGSQTSFITESLVDKLNYVPYVKNTYVSGIALSSNICNKMVNIKIHSNSNQSKSFKLSCVVLPVITGHLPPVKLNCQAWQIPSHLTLADPLFMEPSEADLLIGSDLYYSLLTQGMFQLGRGLPTMLNTHLGWILGGVFSQPKKGNPYSHLSTASAPASVSLFVQNQTSNSELDSLNNVLEKFWEIEELSAKIPLSSEDEFVEKLFKDTTKVLPDGRFQVDIPLKSPSEGSKLGDSLAISKKRFQNLENKFLKHPEYNQEYKKFIEEYVSLGHAQHVPLSLTNKLSQPKYFLPHHAVIREDSVTTKVRVVFDASCKTSSGLSLNDITYKGYQVHPDLYDVLLRFRSFEFVLTTDIEKMFRQIKINPDQTFLLNILWRDTPDSPLECIELQTVTYGTNCAPFLASRVIKEAALRNSETFPMASDALLSQCYVDDVLSGADNLYDLQVLHSQLNSLLNSCGFKLHKWCSNSKLFLNKISHEKPPELDLNLEEAPNKVLGLKWNPTEDSFCISIPEPSLTRPVTKRKILSIIAQCYDPLGFLSPIIITGKLMMQELWKNQIDWDETITDVNILKKWNEFINNLPLLKTLKIPRYLFDKKKIKKIEFVGFCDASEKSYAACVYARTMYDDNTLSCNLVSSKSRVAPVKSQTLPRLELCAMLLLAKLACKLISIFDSRFRIDEVHLWSDSQIALCWIASPASRWNVFVANRVSQIQTLTNNFKWHHVRSADNPADLPSRGIPISTLQDNEIWWHGPTFLCDPDYTVSEETSESDFPLLEEKRNVTLFTVKKTESNSFWSQIFEKFSSYQRLLRAVAYVLRFLHNIKNKDDRQQDALTVDELTKSQSHIIKVLQSLHFAKELHELKTEVPIRNKNIAKLNPFLDNKGLLRVGGRLANADIPYEQKHPILLPSHNKTVSLMLSYEHHRLGHAGAQNVLSSFRLKFWPLNGLKETKQLISRCVTCYRFKAQPATQIMAQLPKDRVNISRAFNRVGIDYGGPYLLKASNLRRAPLIKCYIAIFVCMATKAVHIELVTGLSTNDFIKTLKRFISRRGNPEVIYSDNATNFVGANNQLKELYQLFQNKDHVNSVKEYLSLNEIQFNFIPPRSPHWGGIWEAAIKSTKYHLSRLIGDSHFTFEDFYTVLTQIEAILNSRPLCTLSSDPNDLQVLTPGHFLIGSSLTAYPEKDVSNTPINRLSLYDRIKQIQQVFWKRWTVDYLNRLQHRPKWIQPTQNLKVDTVVLIRDDFEYPLKWPLAKIIEILPGSDGKVRAVKLQTQDGVCTRSIAKVCPLPEEGLWHSNNSNKSDVSVAEDSATTNTSLLVHTW